MPRQKLLTKQAAEFCTRNGRRITAKSLRVYRSKKSEDPGEHGPRFYRDAVTGRCYYDEADLEAWIVSFEARLIEGGRGRRPSWLEAAA